VPHLIDVIVSLLLHHMRTGEHLYSNGSNGQRITYTRVQERCKFNFKFVVGGFSASDLGVYCYVADSIGVACARMSIGLCLSDINNNEATCTLI